MRKAAPGIPPGEQVTVSWACFLKMVQNLAWQYQMFFPATGVASLLRRRCHNIEWERWLTEEVTCPNLATLQPGTTRTSASSAGAASATRAPWRATSASTRGRSPTNVTAAARSSASSTSWRPTTACTQVNTCEWCRHLCYLRLWCVKEKQNGTHGTLAIVMLTKSKMATCVAKMLCPCMMMILLLDLYLSECKIKSFHSSRCANT